MFLLYFCAMNNDHENILLKVRQLYMKYGIKSITMDEVSNELGISKKTLYQFVADKDELVGKVLDYEIEIRQNQIFNCSKSSYNAVEELLEISEFMNRLIRDQNPATEHDLKKYYPHHYQKILKARREGVYSYILMNLKKGKEEGLYREELDAEIIAKLYLSRSESIHLNDLFTVEEYTSWELFLELITYHIRGIATKKGIVVFEKKIKELEKINK